MANGYFRANPDAVSANNLRLESPTPGTLGTDTDEAANVSGETGFKGINYTGLDGVEALYLFRHQDPVTGEFTPYTTGIVAADVRAAVLQELDRHEVDPVFNIVVNGATDWDMTHIGAGTLNGLVAIDGTEFEFARA